jgi:glycosyltransferase involved in cell wall biosynthesis
LQWTGADDEVALLLKRLQLTEFVEIIGTYSHQDAASLYARGDILLHLKYKDPCPNVVIEAMACGLFVIGSRSGGLPELLGNCGALLPVEESWDEMVYPTVVEVCEAVIEATDTLIARKSAARQRAVTEFSSDSWIETHGYLFRRLLQG